MSYSSERELKQAIRAYLSAGPPEEVREEVQRLEMELATPGDWEAAKYAPDPQKETQDNNE